MTDARVLYQRENDAYSGKPQYLVVVDDYETGSSTSFTADHLTDARRKVMEWLDVVSMGGIDERYYAF